MWTSDFDSVLRNHCRLGTPDQEIDPDIPLVTLGVDSYAVVEMIVDLEDHLGRALPDEMLTPEVFHSPATLWSAVQDLVGQSPPAH